MVETNQGAYNKMSNMLFQILIITIPALFASQGVWSLILYQVQKKNEKKDLRTRADLAILHDLVYRYCCEAIARGYTGFDEFDDINSLYEIYTAIGGNGTGKKLYEEYCKLPKKSMDK